MSFVRSALAVALILAALSGSTVHAQEVAEGEAEYVEYVEYAEPEALAPMEPLEIVAVAEPIVAPIAEPTVAAPTPVPTPMPTLAPAPTATPVAAAPATGKVAAVVVDNRFQPGELNIAVGATVTWTNNGFNFHTLSTQDGQFNSGPLAGSQSFSFTFQKAGDYVLICRQHLLNGMTGRINVQ